MKRNRGEAIYYGTAQVIGEIVIRSAMVIGLIKIMKLTETKVKQLQARQ